MGSGDKRSNSESPTAGWCVQPHPNGINQEHPLPQPMDSMRSTNDFDESRAKILISGENALECVRVGEILTKAPNGSIRVDNAPSWVEMNAADKMVGVMSKRGGA